MNASTDSLVARLNGSSAPCVATKCVSVRSSTVSSRAATKNYAMEHKREINQKNRRPWPLAPSRPSWISPGRGPAPYVLSLHIRLSSHTTVRPCCSYFLSLRPTCTSFLKKVFNSKYGEKERVRTALARPCPLSPHAR